MTFKYDDTINTFLRSFNYIVIPAPFSSLLKVPGEAKTESSWETALFSTAGHQSKQNSVTDYAGIVTVYQGRTLLT